MTLDLFQTLPDLTEEQLHWKFKFLRNNPLMEGERKAVVKMTEGFIDRDNKIVKEFQTTFHSSFWEFSLFQVLQELGFEIDFTKDRPDFITTKPIKMNIEAVIANIKEGGREESSRSLDDVLSMSIPPHLQENYSDFLDESIVRNSNAIQKKSKKYLEEYSKLDWVDEDEPFVIALSSYDQVNYGREYYYSLVALLYGRYYNSQSRNYEAKDAIVKPNTDSSIPIGIFNNPEMEHVSAIIFSCTNTLGKLTALAISENLSDFQMNMVINIRHEIEPTRYGIQKVSHDTPESISDGVFIFHNPKAKNKLSKELFSATDINQFIVDGNGFKIEGVSPLVARLNLPKLFYTDELANEIFVNFNK